MNRSSTKQDLCKRKLDSFFAWKESMKRSRAMFDKKPTGKKGG